MILGEFGVIRLFSSSPILSSPSLFSSLSPSLFSVSPSQQGPIWSCDDVLSATSCRRRLVNNVGGYMRAVRLRSFDLCRRDLDWVMNGRWDCGCVAARKADEISGYSYFSPFPASSSPASFSPASSSPVKSSAKLSIPAKFSLPASQHRHPCITAQPRHQTSTA